MTLFVSLSFTFLSQSPEGINYQAVMRNGLTLAANQNINVKFELKKVTGLGGVGPIVYTETHNVITNSLGLVNLTIGEGIADPSNVTNFDLIDWGSDQYFLATSVDFNGGTNFQFFGEQRLMSVPYALYSKEASSITGGMPDISTDGTPGNITIDNGSTLLINVDDSDADPSNELNTGIQLNGTNIEITDNGGTLSEDLSPLLGTDDQNIQGSSFDNITNNLTIGIENGNSETVDLSGLANSGSDDQNIQGSSFDITSNNLTIGIENGTSETIDLSNLDNSGTDDQNIQGSSFDNITNNLTIGIENGTDETIDLSALDNTGTDDQQLTLNQNTLTLEDGGTPIDLTQFLDNTDNQQINTFNYNPANSIITLDLQNGGGPQTIDLSALNDNDWGMDANNIYRNIGNVGIGTTNPTRKLHVENNDNAYSGYFNNTSTNSSVARYGIWNVMSNQAIGMSTAFRNSNYIGSSNATHYGIRNEIVSGGQGNRYGIYNSTSLQGHNGSGTIYGMYSYLYGGTNTTGNTYGVRVSNNTVGSGADYGFYSTGEDYNYFQGNVGIGVTDPDAKLEVNGQVKITGGSPGANKVLTSDANGLASWQNLSGGDNDWVISNNGNVYNNSGNVGIGTSSIDAKLVVDGDTKVKNGYLMVGSPSSGNVTRKGSQTFQDGGPHVITDGTQTKSFTWSLGNLDIPPGASSITIKSISILWQGWNEDANEDFHVLVKVGGSSWGTIYSGSAAIFGGGNDYFTHFEAFENVNTTFSSAQSVQFELYDENVTGWFAQDDDFRLDGIELTIYYQYTSAPTDGSIYTEGRVYANSSRELGDVAEYFPIEDFQIKPGMIVSLDKDKQDKYKLSTSSYDDHMVGVISEDPSVVLNSPEVGPPVGLAGRVR